MKERNSNIEALRIISTIMVLGLHYLNPNIGGALGTSNTINYVLCNAFESLCIISVNVFVIITGYFSCETKKMKLRKIIELYLILEFYNFAFYFVSILLNYNSFSIMEILCILGAFFVGKGWFIETYILLMLFVPFINVLINHLNKKQMLLLIVIYLIVFSVWESFLPSPPMTDGGYGILHFVSLYLLGAYIKKHVEISFDTKLKTRSLIALLMFVLFTFISCFVLHIKDRAWNYCYISNVFAAAALFIVFACSKDRHNRIINWASKSSFGILIFHASPYIQPLIYDKAMHVTWAREQPTFVILFLLSIIAQYLVCLLIDSIRQVIWKYTINHIADNRATKSIETRINSIIE